MTTPIETWEYKRIDDPTDAQLDDLGMTGWELVGVSTYEIGGGAVINGLGGERYRVHFRHSFKRPARQRCPACAGLVVMAGGNCNACGATVEPHPSFARIQGLVKKEEIVMSQERLVALYGITFKWNLYHWNGREFKTLDAAIEAARAVG